MAYISIAYSYFIYRESMYSRYHDKIIQEIPELDNDLKGGVLLDARR